MEKFIKRNFNYFNAAKNQNGLSLGSVTHLTFSLLFEDRVTIIELKITTASGVKIFKHASSAQSSNLPRSLVATVLVQRNL